MLTAVATPERYGVPWFTLRNPLNVNPDANFGPGVYVKKDTSFPYLNTVGTLYNEI